MEFKKTLKMFSFFAAFVFSFAASLAASGYHLGVQDARANGFANAFAAVADNAAAAWYNPAATVFLDGNNVIGMGVVAADLHIKHENTAEHGGGTDRTKPKTAYLPAAYAVSKINENMAVSIGVNAPFGISSTWENDAKTADTAIKSEQKDINYNVNLAYKFSEKLSAAIGIDYGQMTARLTSSTLEVIADKTPRGGFGWNTAILYRPADRWSLSASYRSSVKATLTGTVESRYPPVYQFFGNVEADLEMPDLASIGAAYRANDKWLFSLQGDYVNWTTYDKLVFKDRDSGNVLLIAGVKPMIQHKGFGPAYAVRMGTEYSANSSWKLRAGLAYDTNPVYSKYFETRVPDSDRIEAAIGATYQAGNFSIDISYCRVQFLPRTVKDSHASGTAVVDAHIDGTYKTYADMPAISFGYKF